MTVTGAVVAWEEAAEYQVSADYQEEGRLEISVRFTDPPPVAEWALAAGDLLNNLRCALDHAVYALAIIEAGQDPPPQATRLAFPIADTEKGWRRAARRALGPRSNTAQDAIGSLQPGRWAGSTLALLRELNNEDKHRLLKVSVFSLQQGALNLGRLIPGRRCPSIGEARPWTSTRPTRSP